jgi:AmmeMemoRadiSam system protein B/AmmeMemoRadiSam system protein A
MKVLVVAAVMMGMVWACSAGERPPAVAGSFYPDDPDELRVAVQGMLERAGPAAAPAAALVVPHAGYVFSGEVAARGFAALRGARPKRVILLGPSHHRGFEGGALPAAGVTAFSTPLGPIPLDTDALARLRSSPELGGPPAAHDPEHCLEVELPFLAEVAPGAKLVPILLGVDTDLATCRAIARTLAPLLDERTVVVASTDFTHHGAAYGFAPFGRGPMVGPALVRLARATAERAAAGDVRGFWNQVEVSGDSVCGVRAVAVLPELVARAFDGRGKLLDVTTSGHVSGTWDQAVTYVAVAFEGSWRPYREAPEDPALGTLTHDQGEQLLELARATLRSHLVHDESLAAWFARYPVEGQLRGHAGAFVTLNNRGEKAKNEGRLRACMGVIEAVEPAVDAVMSSAVTAAHDPRFPRLTAPELDQVDLEVSVLSPPGPVPGPEAIRVGTHGVILHKSGRSAVFLPQVAPEQGWGIEETLTHLAMKAGLSPDAWREGAEYLVFEAQVIREKR